MEAKHKITVGDIVFPYIWRKIGAKIFNIDKLAVWWHSGRDCYYTTVADYDLKFEREMNYRESPKNVKLIGWCNILSIHGAGLKVFIPELEERGDDRYKFLLMRDEAVQITKVFFKSVEGEIVKFRINNR